MQSTRICSVEDCSGRVLARTWCSKHYTRWYETGSLELGVRTGERKPSASLESRFWQKVNMAGGTEYLNDPLAAHDKLSGECWSWTSSKTALGYGSIWDNSVKKSRMAHRISLEIALGAPVDSDLVTDHLCRNPSCVNPGHLEMVTVSENTKRGLAPIKGAEHNRRKTECPQGHPYSPENTYIYGDGAGVRRHCRTCAITRTVERRKRGLK